MRDLWADVRYGLKILFKRKLVTFAALLSLALGIGANTAIFTLINAFFLEPIPAKDASQLVALYGSLTRDGERSERFFPFSHLDYLDYREKPQGLTDILAHRIVDLSLSEGGDAERIRGAAVTGNFFDVLGLDGAAGRFFAPDDEDAKNAVMVIGYRLWQQRFNGDPAVVGSSVLLNRQPFTIVGVTAEGYRGITRVGDENFWIPLSTLDLVGRREAFMLPRRNGRFLQLIGRLADGVEVTAAQAALDNRARQLAQEYPDTNEGWGVTAIPLGEIATQPERRGQQQQARKVLLGAAALVLLLACVNIGMLLLARAEERYREIAVRLSLGASRLRLARQLITESVVLALLGGIAGILVAWWGVKYLWSLRPPFFAEGSLDLSLDGRILLFAFGLSMLTGILFGLAPALKAWQTDLVTPLKDATARTGTVYRRWGMRNLIIIFQIGLCLVSLVSAGLFVRSLAEARQIDLGFESENLLLAALDLSSEGYDEPRGQALSRQLVERLSNMPGASAAAVAETRLLSGFEFLSQVYPQGRDLGDDEGGLIRTNSVTSDYFEAVGIPLVRGRSFTLDDAGDSPPVAIINQLLADRYWPGEDPVGLSFRLDDEEIPVEIVGVAANSKYISPGEEYQPYVYLPLDQRYFPRFNLYVRTTGSPQASMGALRQEVKNLDPDLAVLGLNTIGEAIDRTLWTARMGAGLLTFFGALALILAVVGIYGVMSYSLSQRLGEFGLRQALGAQRMDVLKMVLKEAMILIGCGIAVGIVGTLVLNRALGSLLYDLDPTDPVVLVGLSLFLAVVALLATLIPARRATNVDPGQALRPS